MSFTQVPPNSTGNKIDCVQLVDGADTVQRQVVTIGDPAIVGRIMGINADGSINAVVAAASLPLPTGAATEATLGAINGYFKAEDTAHTSGDMGLPIFGIRNDSDIPTAADGEYTVLKLDEEGRLKVAAKPASYPDITGDITAIQASISVPVAGGTVAGDVSRASNIMIFCTGTFSTVNCTFEGSLEASGDTNWFGVQVVRSNANTIETTTGNLSAQPAYAWEASVNALKRFRVRCTARTSGTQSWRFVQGTYATEPVPAIQASTMAISGVVAVYGQPQTSSGGATSHHHAISAASTNATSVKTTSGTITDITLSNNGAGVAYFKLYMKTSAPVVGTDTPIMTVLIPVNGTVVVTFPMGKRLGGIAYAIAGGMAVSDTTAVGAAQVSVGMSYV